MGIIDFNGRLSFFLPAPLAAFFFPFQPKSARPARLSKSKLRVDGDLPFLSVFLPFSATFSYAPPQRHYRNSTFPRIFLAYLPWLRTRAFRPRRLGRNGLFLVAPTPDSTPTLPAAIKSQRNEARKYPQRRYPDSCSCSSSSHGLA